MFSVILFRRGVVTALTTLLMQGCLSSAEVVLPELPEDAQSILLLSVPKVQSQNGIAWALERNGTWPAFAFGTDEQDYDLHILTYACSLESLELPKGAIKIRTDKGARALPIRPFQVQAAEGARVTEGTASWSELNGDDAVTAFDDLASQVRLDLPGVDPCPEYDPPIKVTIPGTENASSIPIVVPLDETKFLLWPVTPSNKMYEVDYEAVVAAENGTPIPSLPDISWSPSGPENEITGVFRDNTGEFWFMETVFQFPDFDVRVWRGNTGNAQEVATSSLELLIGRRPRHLFLGGGNVQGTVEIVFTATSGNSLSKMRFPRGGRPVFEKLYPAPSLANDILWIDSGHFIAAGIQSQEYNNGTPTDLNAAIGIPEATIITSAAKTPEGVLVGTNYAELHGLRTEPPLEIIRSDPQEDSHLVVEGTANGYAWSDGQQFSLYSEGVDHYCIVDENAGVEPINHIVSVGDDLVRVLKLENRNVEIRWSKRASAPKTCLGESS